ncbi:hypothetical protein TIFTF001_029460 [Ficus carica]|uniref:Uncharacterized protein n=1 Tax=Ficus carica TaxID=3494 RepID=A0AA88DRI9_FICCA|nr:hypothetical protein TIFTF001_029460 [Ficus carica]
MTVDQAKILEANSANQERKGASSRSLNMCLISIVELLKRGHLKKFLSDKGAKHMAFPKTGSNVTRRSSETPLPPPMKKTIEVILGGSVCSGNLGSSIRKHIKNASTPPPNYLPSDSFIDHIISFHEKEATELCRPHDNALVITHSITNCQVGRILVDNGSSTDILFLTALKEMDNS